LKILAVVDRPIVNEADGDRATGDGSSHTVYPRGQLEVNIEGFAGRNLAVTSGRHSQRIISRCYFRDWGLILVGYYFQAHHFKFIGRIERIHRPVVKLNYSAAPGDVAWIGPNTHRMLLRRKHGSV
jgi:hypothetical protein